GRIILVVGRSSSVLGTPFYNGDLLEDVLREGVPFCVRNRRHRVFVNRFGEHIYEEIIIADRTSGKEESVEVGRSIGMSAMKSALEVAPMKVRPAIEEALEEATRVAPSPKLDIPVPVRVAYMETKIRSSTERREGRPVEVTRSSAHGDKLNALL